MRHRACAIILLAAACATAVPTWAPVARTAPESCSAPGAPAGVAWQLVTAPGLTFCMAPGWHARDASTWIGTAGSVTWGTGTPPARSGAVVVRDYVRSCQVRGGCTAYEPSGPPSCSDNRGSEVIGGQAATVYDLACSGRHMTGATWREAGIWFQGDAEDGQTASLELMVFRTMRFVGPAGP